MENQLGLTSWDHPNFICRNNSLYLSLSLWHAAPGLNSKPNHWFWSENDYMENCVLIPQKSDLMLKMYLTFQKTILMPVIKLQNEKNSTKRSSLLSRTSNTFALSGVVFIRGRIFLFFFWAKVDFCILLVIQSRFPLFSVSIICKDTRLQGLGIEPATFGSLTREGLEPLKLRRSHF